MRPMVSQSQEPSYWAKLLVVGCEEGVLFIK